MRRHAGKRFVLLLLCRKTEEVFFGRIVNVYRGNRRKQNESSLVALVAGTENRNNKETKKVFRGWGLARVAAPGWREEESQKVWGRSRQEGGRYIGM